MRSYRPLLCATTTCLLAGGLIASGPSAVAATSEDQVTCAGAQLTIRTNNNNSGDNGGWSSVQVVAGGTGHLTPISFYGIARDITIDKVIFEFSSAKGNGHANNQQATTTCTQHGDGTLADLLAPGEPAPPGTSLTDEVTFDFTAVVVRKP